MEKIYIIWDNSNIHYGGMNQVFPLKEPDEVKELYRTHFLNLLNLVVGERKIGQVYFVGSTPPKEDTIWNYLYSIGINPERIPRPEGGEWNTTDHLLQNHLLRLGFFEVPETVALLSGDGRGITEDEGFFADLRRLVGKKWNIELYSWKETCHQDLMAYAKSVGKYVELNDYYYSITFLKDKRYSEKLPQLI